MMSTQTGDDVGSMILADFIHDNFQEVIPRHQQNFSQTAEKN